MNPLTQRWILDDWVSCRLQHPVLQWFLRHTCLDLDHLCDQFDPRDRTKNEEKTIHTCWTCLISLTMAEITVASSFWSICPSLEISYLNNEYENNRSAEEVEQTLLTSRRRHRADDWDHLGSWLKSTEEILRNRSRHHYSCRMFEMHIYGEFDPMHHSVDAEKVRVLLAIILCLALGIELWVYLDEFLFAQLSTRTITYETLKWTENPETLQD